MKLTGKQYKQLQQALLDAFPTKADLQQMVTFELGENLAVIAGGGDLSEITFNLIRWAQAQGTLEDLIQGAIRSNPKNPALQQVAAIIKGDVSAQTSSTEETSPKNTTQTIHDGRDYFERVEGNVYTGPVTIHSGRGGDSISSNKTEMNTTVSLSPFSNAKQDALRVFICYAREDLHVARRLYADLRQAGIIPWLDVEDLLPGQQWRLVINRAIKDSAYAIVLLSSHSLSKRGFVQKEMKRALNLVDERPPDEIFVIPVRLDDCDPVDERLQELHWVDLFPSYQDGLQRILKVLSAKNIEETSFSPNSQFSKIHLRSGPVMISPAEATERLKLSKEWQPLAYIENDFEDRDTIVLDHATGLMWQQSGSETSLTSKQTQVYINELNHQKFADYDDWRLPTVEELISLLESSKQSHNLYINPVFDNTQQTCWSADALPSVSLWYVDFHYGDVSGESSNVTNYVRAVRSW